jgi:hypothetical protein
MCEHRRAYDDDAKWPPRRTRVAREVLHSLVDSSARAAEAMVVYLFHKF